MKLEKGNNVVIFCMAEKPSGKIVSVNDNIVKIELEKGGLLTCDVDDLVEDAGEIQVLNYREIQDVSFNRNINARSKFEEDMMEVAVKFKDMKRSEIPSGEAIFKMFMEYSKNSVKVSEELYPVPCMFNITKGKNEGIGLAGLALPQHHTYIAISGLLQQHNPSELIFGNMFENMKGGKVDAKYKYVYCIARMTTKISDGSIDKHWDFGVCGVNDKSDIDENNIKWDDTFWNERMQALLVSSNIIESKFKIGTAYEDKIEITKWLELDEGYMYEGKIIESNLDKKTRDFIKAKKIDVSKMSSIEKFFEDNGTKLNFSAEDGKIDLLVENTGMIFTNRNSKTRALLEALEGLANGRVNK